MSASPEADRRGFLRGLVSLPLIGGGLALTGQPTAAAVPLSRVLLDSYDAWLHFERKALRWERFGPDGIDRAFDGGKDIVFRHLGVVYEAVRVDNPGGDFHDFRPGAPRAVDRAAVVLSAVGCEWRARS